MHRQGQYEFLPVLVVAGSSWNRRAERLLADDGFRLVVCSTAEETWRRLAEDSFELVVFARHVPDCEDQVFVERLHDFLTADKPTRLLLSRPLGDRVESLGAEGAVPVLHFHNTASLLRAMHRAAREVISEALQQTEQRYRHLLDTTTDSILIADADTGQIMDANTRVQQLLGYSLSQLQQMRQWEVHPPEERLRYRQLYEHQLRGGRGLVSELNVLHRSGRRIPVEIHCSEREFGGLRLIHSILKNVTERKRSEQALRMSDERFRQLTESIDEVFWLIDQRTEAVLYVSPAFESIWGRPCAVVQARPAARYEVIHEDDRQRVASSFQQRAVAGRYDEQYRILRSDGEVRWIRERAFPITDARGSVYRVATVAVDITQQRRVQDELRMRDMELAHVARLSTMGELVAELAHEINQPLYAITNYANACRNILQSQPPDAENHLRQWTDQIAEQANRAGDIIRRIGRFVRKDAGQEELLHVNALINDAVRLVELEIRSNEVFVELHLDDELPHVSVNKLLLEQVLVNLIQNAIDAMREINPPNRRLTIRTCSGPPAQVAVSISDTGTGIQGADPGRLFEPFYSTKQHGLVLGLAI
jgi:PAS domain S-box-containing protein